MAEFTRVTFTYSFLVASDAAEEMKDQYGVAYGTGTLGRFVSHHQLPAIYSHKTRTQGDGDFADITFEPTYGPE